MSSVMRMSRLNKEMKMFREKTADGISCKPVVEDVYDLLTAQIKGPEGSPYENGTFTLEIKIPERYPLEPPHVKFITQIYHPNVDKAGRICMDMLKIKSEGWTPSISLESLLIAIQYLMSNPNPDDPLVMEIANEYKYDHETYVQKAREHTEKHAFVT